jgi:serine/threonine-protein kinase
MVGYRNPSSLLQCNTYLRVYNEAPSSYNICIDPGSQIDFPMIDANLKQLIGGISQVNAISVNHQDPDVIGNAPAFCEANERIRMLTSQETWRLAQHLAFVPGTIEFAGETDRRALILGNRVRWQVVPTPFCHFRGAVAFYDPEIRTLFTGDLFGGLNQLGRVHLFAEEPDWAGVAQFHQIYMPSREGLRYSVRQIRALSPAVEIIAPQHGHVIVGEQVELALERMEELLVGIDLMAFEFGESNKSAYATVMSDLVKWMEEIVGRSVTVDRISTAHNQAELAPYHRIVNGQIEITNGGYSALGLLFSALTAAEQISFANEVRNVVFAWCGMRNLPVPPLGVGVERLPNSD